MTEASPLRGPEIPVGGTASALVVLLHGLGADGNDLIDIAARFAPDFPDVVWSAPDAPHPCDMAPYGRQWFSLRDRTLSAMAAGVASAHPPLSAFLDHRRRALDLPWSRVILVGFSQGTMMALHTALRLPEPVAGVIGFSGAMVGAERLAADVSARPRVLLIHGEEDEVVPWQASSLASQMLAGAGVDVELHLRPRLGHWIDPEGLQLARDFLHRTLR